MPTRSKPIVSCMSIAWAIATLVPTPSAEVASSGRSYALSAEASKSPAKPPMPPIISGRRAFSTQPFISSTALSPASIETPAAAYAPSRAGHGSGRSRESSSDQGLLRTGSASDASDVSSRCLPSSFSSGSGIGYSPVKQAWQSRSSGWPVASIMPSSEM